MYNVFYDVMSFVMLFVRGEFFPVLKLHKIFSEGKKREKCYPYCLERNVCFGCGGDLFCL